MKPDFFEPDGLERLLDRVEQDPEASRELDFLADLLAAAEREGRDRRRERSDPRKRYLVRPWLLAAAAAVLFALATGLWYARRAGEPGARFLAAHAPPRYVAVELRAGEERTAFEQAMESYLRSDWGAARLALEAVAEHTPDHGPTHFYLAASLEQLGELQRAEEHYERASSAPDPLLAAHARLRLALLWLARGERARAQGELERLRDGGGELAPNAAELLDELGKR